MTQSVIVKYTYLSISIDIYWHALRRYVFKTEFYLTNLCCVATFYYTSIICSTILWIVQKREGEREIVGQKLLKKSISIPANFWSAKHLQHTFQRKLNWWAKRISRTPLQKWHLWKSHEFMTWIWCDCTVLIFVHRMLNNKSFIHFFFRRRQVNKNKSGSLSKTWNSANWIAAKRKQKRTEELVKFIFAMNNFLGTAIYGNV